MPEETDTKQKLANFRPWLESYKKLQTVAAYDRRNINQTFDMAMDREIERIEREAGGQG